MFENGVKGYVKTVAVVKVNFPIDYNDNEDIKCVHCPYLGKNDRICLLNNEIIAFPYKYVGQKCPRRRVDE